MTDPRAGPEPRVSFHIRRGAFRGPACLPVTRQTGCRPLTGRGSAAPEGAISGLQVRDSWSETAASWPHWSYLQCG